MINKYFSMIAINSNNEILCIIYYKQTVEVWNNPHKSFSFALYNIGNAYF